MIYDSEDCNLDAGPHPERPRAETVEEISISSQASPPDMEGPRISKGSRVSATPSVLAFEAESGIVRTTVSPHDQGNISGRMNAVFSVLSKALLLVFAYAALLFAFKVNYLLPFDSGFAVLVLWLGATIGGHAAQFVGLPPLLGMLGAGMLAKNCGDLARGLPGSWGMGIRAFGLMNILMRGGLEMDFGAVKRLGFAVVRLTVMPGVSEALASAAFGVAIFDMPFFLALAMGFILAAVSPAVVVGGMFNLQRRGFGVDKGIPSLVVAAASFDDVVAISGFSMFIGLAVGKGDVLMSALHGPIEIGLGILHGMLGACIMTATKIWDKGWKRSGALLLLGVGFTFAAKYAHFSGAGALASLVMAGASAQFWAKGFGGPLSLGPNPTFGHEVEHDLCLVWKYGSEPLLFGVIGSSLDFARVEGTTVPKAIAVIMGGVIIRCTIAFFATIGAGLTARERLFIALAWMPKATVQAALGSVPLDMVRETLNREDDPAKYDRYSQHGIDIVTVAVFSILVTAPAGLLVIQHLGPAWLQKVDDKADDVLNLKKKEVDHVGPTDTWKKVTGGTAVEDVLEHSALEEIMPVPPGVCNSDSDASLAPISIETRGVFP